MVQDALREILLCCIILEEKEKNNCISVNLV